MTSSEIDERLQRRQAALRKLKAVDSTATEKSAAIPRRDPNLPVLLSFAQQRLWFLDQLVPANPFYNISVPVPLHLPIDPLILEQALNAIVARHEALRTSFVEHSEGTRQVVAPELIIRLEVDDLRAQPELKRRAQVELIAAGEAKRPFNLS